MKMVSVENVAVLIALVVMAEAVHVPMPRYFKPTRMNEGDMTLVIMSDSCITLKFTQLYPTKMRRCLLEGVYLHQIACTASFGGDLKPSVPGHHSGRLVSHTNVWQTYEGLP